MVFAVGFSFRFYKLYKYAELYAYKLYSLLVYPIHKRLNYISIIQISIKFLLCCIYLYL